MVRVPRTLPKILAPAEVDRLVAALRTQRDRAMVAAMLLAGLRRCEVLGLHLHNGVSAKFAAPGSQNRGRQPRLAAPNDVADAAAK